jgi:hypothetical protein
MFENKNQRCRNCRYWWPTGETGNEVTREHAIFGQCRCHGPPVLAAELPDHKVRYPAWASTKRDDWCGEHANLTN